jgi:quercetin 2,3-dioxygenase
LQVARGSVVLDGETLSEGDGVAISTSGTVRLEGRDDAEVLLFDMGP